MQAAIDRGPHKSALLPDAIGQLRLEVEEKVAKGQARVVDWEDIKDNPPPQLKISPISVIPHKSRKYRTILDLSFSIRLKDGTMVPSVNEASEKTAPRGAINQIGHTLGRIIHAFASTAPDEKIFMAKWDIKDGFWRLDCAEGEEWNFAYVLPQLNKKSTLLVVPKALQMGWIESPPYFCAATETGRDIATQYIETPVGSRADHKFLPLTQQSEAFTQLDNDTPPSCKKLRYLVEVYVDDYVGLAIPTTQSQLNHVANSVMCAIHDIFPPDDVNANDPISFKKLLQKEGSWDIIKEILGFVFDGAEKTLWLSDGKRDALIATIKAWLRSSRKNARFGIPFQEFRSVIYKVRHAFTAIPAGRGLLSPFYGILGKEPAVVFLRRNKMLTAALQECCVFLRESISHPTPCRCLVGGWPDIVGVTDASSHGVGGVVFGENIGVPPTVFRLPWPAAVQADSISASSPGGQLTNSDLEMAALLLLFLVIEAVGGPLHGRHIALYSDNSPSVHWVQRLATRSSTAAAHLVRALALRLQMTKASPLTTLHIAGSKNAMTDVPSRSFGTPKKWSCATDQDFLRMYNSFFPLPLQESWNYFRLSSAASMKVISILLTRDSSVEEWRRLPKLGQHIGTIGKSLSSLWGWTLTYRESDTVTESASSPALPHTCVQGTPAEDAESQLRQYLLRCQPLERRSPWPSGKTPRN
jgi:hypothetical protein